VDPGVPIDLSPVCPPVKPSYFSLRLRCLSRFFALRCPLPVGWALPPCSGRCAVPVLGAFFTSPTFARRPPSFQGRGGLFGLPLPSGQLLQFLHAHASHVFSRAATLIPHLSSRRGLNRHRPLESYELLNTFLAVDFFMFLFFHLCQFPSIAGGATSHCLFLGISAPAFTPPPPPRPSFRFAPRPPPVKVLSTPFY